MLVFRENKENDMSKPKINMSLVYFPKQINSP